MWIKQKQHLEFTAKEKKAKDMKKNSNGGKKWKTRKKHTSKAKVKQNITNYQQKKKIVRQKLKV